MTRTVLTTGAALCAFVGAAPAMAAGTLTINGSSGTFGNTAVTCADPTATSCTFSDTYTFTTPTGYNLGSFGITSTETGTAMPDANGVGGPSDINFTTVSLNGANFSIVSSGYSEFRQLLNQALVSNQSNTLIVSGYTGGAASYSGTLTFAAAATAVPEAATWGMMIVGFGMVGYALRRRRAVAALA